jgi:putative transposase
MPNYRRKRQGELYFFTIVTCDRRPIFDASHARHLLHTAIDLTQKDHPWTMEAIVLLPDHLHMLWRLPEGDTDYSSRIGALKKRFMRRYLMRGGREGRVAPGQRRHRRRGVWQQRFWEHTISDARDFHRHVDYIHTNPVKHGLVDYPRDWPHSSFHRYVKTGWYESDWCGQTDLPGNVEYVWAE